jgi:hypothetical protein
MPNREKVEFPANIPTVVELDGIGTLQASKSGDDEYRYFLRSNRIMWVPPAVHEQLESAAANSGDVFEICKRQAKARAPITWTVRPAETPVAGHGYSNQADTHHDVRIPGQGWTTREGPRPQLTPQRAATAAAAYPPPILPAQRPQPAAPQRGPLAANTPELPLTAADRMAAALRDAIDLIRGAASYEPSIAWTSSDVRAIAATIFIEQSKGARQ